MVSLFAVRPKLKTDRWQCIAGSLDIRHSHLQKVQKNKQTLQLSLFFLYISVVFPCWEYLKRLKKGKRQVRFEKTNWRRGGRPNRIFNVRIRTSFLPSCDTKNPLPKNQDFWNDKWQQRKKVVIFRKNLNKQIYKKPFSSWFCLRNLTNRHTMFYRIVSWRYFNVCMDIRKVKFPLTELLTGTWPNYL